MSRNSGGTYSLPVGNPVVASTTISPTWANSTLTDLGTEVTNSLDRGGRGGMTAPLPLANGTAALPALCWTSDPDTGLYRIGANNPGLAAGGVKVQEWTAGGTTFPLGLIATQSTANGQAGQFTGNGTGQGLIATGGSTNGTGATLVGGGSNGVGAAISGVGSGAAVSAQSGSGNAVDALSTTGYSINAVGNSNKAPIHIGSNSGAPSTATDGDVYYDSGTNKLRVRAGGSWVDLH